MLNSNKAQKHLMMLLTLLICFNFSTTTLTTKPAMAEEMPSKAEVASSQERSQSSEKMLMDAINSIKQQLSQLENRVNSLETKVEKINPPNEDKLKNSTAQKWIEFSNSTANKAEPEKGVTDNKEKTDKGVQDKNSESKEGNTVSIEETKVEDVEKNTKNIEDANPDEKVESQCPSKATKSEKVEEKATTSSTTLTVTSSKQESNPEQIDSKSIGYKYQISVEKITEEAENFGQISIAGKPIIIFRSSLAGNNPIERATIAAKKLESLLAKGLNISNVQPIEKNGLYYIAINDDAIFTIDPETAKKAKVSQASLALSWVNNIRTAMGLPKINSFAIDSSTLNESKRDKNSKRNRKKRISEESIEINQPLKQASRSFDRTFSNIGAENKAENEVLPVTKEEKIFKPHSTGGASWYGPGFHGRRASDGSRFNENALTAAHKTLPFGTIVKVTNLNNNKSCIVRITDRGPFIAGRIIDLSKGAASKVGMIGSGVAKVRIEILKK